MGWQDLLQQDETLVLPWVGGTSIAKGPRTWKLSKLPQEPGWYTFVLKGRTATPQGMVDSPGEAPITCKGFLLGDRIVLDSAYGDTQKVLRESERVHLLDLGLERFARIQAGRFVEGGPLFFIGLEMPLGPEDEVNGRFLDRALSLDGVKGVPPSLHAAFSLECWRRGEVERRRAEIEKARELEEAKQEALRSMGSSIGRRELAKTDFAAAAKAALAVSGAVFLDSRPSVSRGEMVVRFSWIDRRFECTCHSETLRIIDSGVCLTAEYDDDDFEQGTKGDSFFTLETLPGVIREADELGKLVVFRHA